MRGTAELPSREGATQPGPSCPSCPSRPSCPSCPPPHALLAIDIDGTLLDSHGRLPTRTARR